MKVIAYLRPNKETVEFDCDPNDLVHSLKERIIHNYFKLWLEDNPDCIGTSLILFFKKDVSFGQLHGEVYFICNKYLFFSIL
jgi:hypothetical protein